MGVCITKCLSFFSHAGGPPHLPAFSHSAFLEALPRAAQAPALTERFANQAAVATFYRRLLESPNFLAWFERRRGAAWAWQVRKSKLGQSWSSGSHVC